MRKLSVKKLHLELSTGRIQALTDGVFAIAMTLLVLNLEVDEPVTGQTVQSLNAEIKGLWPHILHYIESFIILGVFWVEHHLQFHFVKRSNRWLVWFNLVALFFITLIPFSTSLVGEHGNLHFAVLAFEFNMLAAGLAYYIHWVYVTKNNRLVDKDLDPRIVKVYKHGSMIVPVASALAIALSFVSPRWSTLVFLFIPVCFLFYRRY